jgi:cytochrome c-type biogenesis protein CcmH/NrfF
MVLMNLEVYERMEEGKSDERIGIAVLRFSDEQVLKDMEMWDLSFIFGK